MPSTINASSSGSGGLISTADASGVLQLQTNGTTVLTATGSKVGVGTASPQETMQVNGTDAVPTSEIFGFSVSGTSDTTKALRMGYNNANDLAVIAASDYGAGWKNIAIQPTGSNGVVGIGLNPTSRNNTCLQIVNGLGFPATQVASSDANTLDDYEEGTTTIQFADAASGGNGYNVDARYIKIGRMVFLNFSAYYVPTPTWVSANDIFVRGLPFTTQFEGSGGSIMLRYSLSNDTSAYLWQPSTQNYFILKQMDFDTPIKGSNMPSSLTTYANLCYLTAS